MSMCLHEYVSVYTPRCYVGHEECTAFRWAFLAGRFSSSETSRGDALRSYLIYTCMCARACVKASRLSLVMIHHLVNVSPVDKSACIVALPYAHTHAIHVTGEAPDAPCVVCAVCPKAGTPHTHELPVPRHDPTEYRAPVRQAQPESCLPQGTSCTQEPKNQSCMIV
jgi:hypothetical protein